MKIGYMYQKQGYFKILYVKINIKIKIFEHIRIDNTKIVKIEK